MQKIDDILNKTKAQIKSVEAPDYILTRAKQQFENLKEVATPRFIWSTAMATLVLVTFNIYVIGQQAKSKNSTSFESSDVTNIYSSNQLYTNE